MVPSGFIDNPGLPGVPGVSETVERFAGAPLNVSLASTLGVFPPAPPFTGPKLSFTASIQLAASAVTIIPVASGSGHGPELLGIKKA